VRFAARLSLLPLLAPALALALGTSGCSSQTGDPPSPNGAPPPGGVALRVRDVADPTRDGHAAKVSTTQSLSGAVVIAVDTFDETKNGKGTGTVYVQDLGATKDTPYSGISLFATTFSPGNLSVAPGDVLDLRGQYQENQEIPSKPPVVFALGAVLPQIAQATATFRFETREPEPVDIDATDLTDYAKARRWFGMLVRVKSLTLAADPYTGSTGRVSIDLPSAIPPPKGGSACDSPFPKAASLVNDLFDLGAMGLKRGDALASVVGVVGYFCNFKLAPRSKADIKLP
jgi:hypothetical protein